MFLILKKYINSYQSWSRSAGESALYLQDDGKYFDKQLLFLQDVARGDCGYYARVLRFLGKRAAFKAEDAALKSFFFFLKLQGKRAIRPRMGPFKGFYEVAGEPSEQAEDAALNVVSRSF